MVRYYIQSTQCCCSIAGGREDSLTPEGEKLVIVQSNHALNMLTRLKRLRTALGAAVLTSVVALSLTMGPAAAAQVQAGNPLNNTWGGTVVVNNTSISVSLDLHTTATTVTGSGSSSAATAQVTSGVISGDTTQLTLTSSNNGLLQMSITINSDGTASGPFTINSQGVVVNGTGSGTVNSNAINLRWSGTTPGGTVVSGTVALTAVVLVPPLPV